MESILGYFFFLIFLYGLFLVVISSTCCHAREKDREFHRSPLLCVKPSGERWITLGKKEDIVMKLERF